MTFYSDYYQAGHNQKPSKGTCSKSRQVWAQMGIPGQTQSELVDLDVNFVNIKDNNIFFPETLMIIECCDLVDLDDFWLTETTFADKM